MLNSIIKEDVELISKVNLPWKDLANSTILISGASGMLPAYLIDTLMYVSNKKNLNIKILAIVRNQMKAKDRFKAYKNSKNLKIIEQDICHEVSFNEKIDYIVHAASQASPIFYRTDPVGTILPNVLGTYYLLELAKKNKIKGFLYFSSGEVYGEVTKKSTPTKENMYAYFDHLNFRSCYGQSKKMGETLCAVYMYQFNIPTKIVRPYHVYGPGMKLNDGRLFSDLIADIIQKRDITLWSEGSAIRSFCYLSDATVGFLSVLLKGNSSEAYNIGNPEATLSVLELANRLIALFPERNIKMNKKNRPKSSVYASSNVEIAYPDVSKAMELGWKPSISIEEGFARTVRSFNEYSEL
ncbi:NAD-dependent epimerase/dehydratase family protein [Rickettsiella endosymbiont of Rhagonycha lignosa]|uniref:NAD-dependent epimerase/dehydratase family protein n=1 Tax=Rickettsiella endosymbiont of Rhagonycha lignosa TaxID=3077937 RepID=UPI00313F3BD8